MKNYLLLIVMLMTVTISAQNPKEDYAQKPMIIADEFKLDESTSHPYTTAKSGKQILYQKEFYSAKASYVKLYFKNFDLAPGDYVEIYSPNNGETKIYGQKGKIIDEQMTMISDFWTQAIFEDKIIVTLYSFGQSDKHYGFDITKVAYGYTSEKLEKILGQKSICNSDNKEPIACYQGTEMFAKGEAVSKLIIGGRSLCTGWLLGCEGNLMTNNHCIGSASAAQNVDVIFNYRKDGCSGSANATSETVATSASFIMTDSGLDFTLLKLPVNPTQKYGYLSLSSVAPAKGDRIYIPQHPGGRRKEISVKSDRDGDTNGFSRVYAVSNSGGQTVRYYADTEGGSSGSPVIKYDSHLVVAIHNTGGCPNGSYGRSDAIIAKIGNRMPNCGVDNGGTPIDDCKTTVNSFPYVQSFENTIGNWAQSTTDDFNWSVQTGATPSRDTGPSAANAGSHYVYMETSSPNYPNKKAILTSPCFDLKGKNTASLSFAYHMYGANTMGSLQLEASIDDGKTWNSIWSKSGNQGNAWNNASVNLASYLGKVVKLRFNGVSGTTWQGDMAIDNFKLSTDSSGGNQYKVTLAITLDNYPEETSWDIKNSAGQVVASGGTYGSEPDGSSISVSENLDAGCYSLTFKDSYGDGICCSYGNGSYTLTDQNGQTLASGGNFGASETKNFCVGGARESTETEETVILERTDVAKETLTAAMSLYPNPAINHIQIQLAAKRTTATSYSILDLSGKTVQQGNFEKTIPVEHLKPGLYMIKIHVSGSTHTASFIKK
ncbi:T9SS type A sorting domain-containing protein [Aquimarina sp. TRL1]|uniref:trypsin-like peptidase domain-containing protein n=1 Tax=Aquimarina sp. (strain TRL1) TaxID=2736252 RepID=UPI00158DEBA4|nr:trypsin-like peptidase domain-containing protein [Aquimarina sp. TRL1]QKX05202.1 T9SS type A sorting domain-containing protein [Aquimarina sp. TRL1]